MQQAVHVTVIFQTPKSINITVLFANAVDFVIPKKGESLLEAYETWRNWADEKGTSVCTIHCLSVLCALIKIKSISM